MNDTNFDSLNGQGKRMLWKEKVMEKGRCRLRVMAPITTLVRVLEEVYEVFIQQEGKLSCVKLILVTFWTGNTRY